MCGNMLVFTVVRHPPATPMQPGVGRAALCSNRLSHRRLGDATQPPGTVASLIFPWRHGNAAAHRAHGCGEESGVEIPQPRSRSAGFGRDREEGPAPSRGLSYFNSVIFCESRKSGVSIVQK